MKIVGPDRYALTFDSQKFASLCPNGTDKFSGIANHEKPKLYVISVGNEPIYVGQTKQRLRKRLYLGWKATGETGYHGYQWRHKFNNALLDIWMHDDPLDNSSLDIEIVEAEVVFLIRSLGQWPRFQNEIHFHESSPIHREAAATIMRTYQYPTSL